MSVSRIIYRTKYNIVKENGPYSDTVTLVITQSATQNRVVSFNANLSRSLKLRVKKKYLNDILTSLEHLYVGRGSGRGLSVHTYNNNDMFMYIYV